jgi:hypothetical protein
LSLIHTPESPWGPFFRGLLLAAANLVAGVVVIAIRVALKGDFAWPRLWPVILIVVGLSVLVGAVYAIPALLYRWAYRRLATDDEPLGD